MPQITAAARSDRGRGSRRSPRLSPSGQALVEFALILPLLLVLTAGVLDMARIFSAYLALTDGVREAALYAAEGTNNTNWCSGVAGDMACPSPDPDPSLHETGDNNNIAYQIGAVGLDVSRVSMAAPVCAPTPCDSTSTVTIRASYSMPLITPLLNKILGDSITVRATTEAKVLP